MVPRAQFYQSWNVSFWLNVECFRAPDASGNARAGRLDEEIAAKEEFKKQQGVLAQQFFTQKLRLRATQEKEWTKFNKMCTSHDLGLFLSGCCTLWLVVLLLDYWKGLVVSN